MIGVFGKKLGKCVELGHDRGADSGAFGLNVGARGCAVTGQRRGVCIEHEPNWRVRLHFCSTNVGPRMKKYYWQRSDS